MKSDKLENVIYFLLEQTQRKAKAHSQQVFNQNGLDITIEQWVLLKIVEQSPNISQNELALKAIKDAASITRMVDLLQKKELLERHPAPDDRRKYLLLLTDKGKAFIQENMDLVVNLRKQGVKGFSKVELEAFKVYLLRMQANLE